MNENHTKSQRTFSLSHFMREVFLCKDLSGRFFVFLDFGQKLCINIFQSLIFKIYLWKQLLFWYRLP